MGLIPFFFLLAAPAQTTLPGKPAERKVRVLIVDGFSNHDWQQTTALIRGILAPSGLFEVAVSTAPSTAKDAASTAWRPRFSDYDVVIQNCNSGGNRELVSLWPEAVRKDFEDFVRTGGGAYIFHAAENSFPGWTAYEQMVGLCWRGADFGPALRVNEDGTLLRIPAGSGGGTGHGKRGDTLVTRLGDHPIHAGMPRAWLTPDMEVYYLARGPVDGVQVLAYARDTKPGQGWLWPVEWTVNFGKGRVYVSTYGHVWRDSAQPAGMRCAAVQTIIPRAVQWLAHRPVTIPVPADFPGADKVSVRAKPPSADTQPASTQVAERSPKAPEITPANGDDAKNFFNGKDLRGFWGDLSLWHVENGELVGKTEKGIGRNEFLKTTHSYGDFRLIVKMKLVPNGANSGIQFHSSQFHGNEMSGPQADAGARYWGSLYGENFHNKTLCPNKAGEAASVHKEDWNLYEIVAVGRKVRTAMNGRLCVDVDLPDMPTTGMFGLQIHAGGPTEVRFKDFELELNPTFALKTVEK